MGALGKIWKGVKTGVKSIAKGIKKAFQSFGKFMNKIGIVGQIAMMFVLPVIGNAIMGTTAAGASAAAAQTLATEAALATGANAATATALGAAKAAEVTATIAAGSAAGASQAAILASKSALTHVGTGLAGGAMGPLGVSAAKAVTWMGQKVAAVKSTFSNITSGIFDTVVNFSKTAVNKMSNTLGFENVFQDAATNFFGPGKGADITNVFQDSAGVADSAFSRSFGADSKFQNLQKGSQFFKDVATDRMSEIEKLNTLKVDAINNLEAPKGFMQSEYSGENLPPPSKIDITTSRLDDLKVEDLTNVKVGAGTPVIDTGAGIESFKNTTTGGVNVNNTGFSPEAQKSLLARKTEMQATIDSLAAAGSTAPLKTGFLKRIGEDLVEKTRDRFGNIMKDPVGSLLKDFENKVSGSVQTKILDAADLIYRPPAAEVDARQYANSPPAFNMTALDNLNPIMDARAFEVNVLHSPTPMGYNALLYGQQMTGFNSMYNNAVSP